MITAPKHLTPQQKTAFRFLAKQMTDLQILHASDKTQIEVAAVLTVQSQLTVGRLEKLNNYIEQCEDVAELSQLLEAQGKVEAAYQKTATALNSTLDKLGISNTKRNPVKRDRGRPENSPGEAPEDKHRRAWKSKLKAVK